MSLDGAKLICLGKDGAQYEDVILAKGKTFKFGYYMDCDVVLEHPEALGLHCTIDCDPFGRVTIANLCKDQNITLNGKPLKKLRPILHNTEICIFDKKFLWLFEKIENPVEYATPSKQTKRAEQPPNSEPGRRWFSKNKRLTIHTFSYSIKSGQESNTEEAKYEQNKTPNKCETIETNSSEPTSTKGQSPIPTAMVDLINLETPKPKKSAFTGQRTPLIGFSLSETVITSYSPLDNSSRPHAKSYAIVQSPVGSPRKLEAQSDVTLGSFKQTSSPLVLKYRPSMHLIDLTTPMKRSVPETPSKGVHKLAHKRNKIDQSPRSHRTQNTSANNTTSSILSVDSTDESVIELSDEGGFSPSPVLKTPPRMRTPQSLMKRAILSSANKAIRKREQPPAAPPPLKLSTPKSPTTSRAVRFHSQSTPQRKSLARIECSSVGRIKASSKLAKSMVTSTPFRADQVDPAKRRSSILRSPSTSLMEGNRKSRTSLMLKQALTGNPKQSKAESSFSCTEPLKTPSKSETNVRKSVSFLKNVECELLSDSIPKINETFSIEEIQDCTNDGKDASSSKKDGTFSLEKESSKNVRDDCIVLSFDEVADDKAMEEDKTKVTPVTSIKENSIVVETPIKKDTNRRSLIKSLSGVTLNSKDKVIKVKDLSATLDTYSPRQNKSSFVELQETDKSIQSVQQTPISSKSHLRKTPLSIKPSLVKNLRNIIDEEDFEGLDAVFKTPKAKNIMILSSPKSIALQKPSIDSVELKHSTEFDLSTNLDDLFKTPQSELLVNRTEVEVAAPGDVDDIKATHAPEEAFDRLVGRSIVKKSYTRTNFPKQKGILPLDTPRNLDLPKTDIEEWIEKVNQSIEHTDVERDEDEISYLTAEQSGVSRDPLMVSSVLDGIATTNKKKVMHKTLNDEIAMTIRKDEEENTSELRDPLEATVVTQLKKSISPNISGIDLLEHSSESTFSETLAISDDSSEKENEQYIALTVHDNTITQTQEQAKASPNKANKEIEEFFKNFEKAGKKLEEKRLVSTPEPKKTQSKAQIVNRRKTLGNSKTECASFDVKAVKEKWEMERAFKNFEDKPVVAAMRAVKTPDAKKLSLKDHRRTMGTKFIPEKELDLEAAKAKREMKLAFENFEEEPAVSTIRVVKTPDAKKTTLKDHRRTMGTKFVPEKELDLEAAKAEREMELAFENFEEDPAVNTNRAVKTPDVKKSSLTDHRRTMGTKFVPEKELDLEAAKAEREMELAFENFEEEPPVTTNRAVKTPDAKKSTLKDHRRTMGTKFVPEKQLDLEVAKAVREMELAFENFEEEPAVRTIRAVKTPDAYKSSLKDHRRTMGTKFVPEKELDLEAAKAEREMELAFENFEEEPAVSTIRAVKTPDAKKTTLKDHRRTMGTKFVPEKELYLEVAKAEREMELAFENFEEEPPATTNRVVKTPDASKSSLKDHRRTMGTKFVPEKELDLEAAKAEREMELAFENFEEEPPVTTNRLVKTPDASKSSLKDHRRTMGTKFVPEMKLDLEAAKAEHEMELAFENFEEEPAVSTIRAVKTPDAKKTTLKDHRRTMGTKFVPEKELDLEAAKAKRETELAFENFEEEPPVTTNRAVKTPDAKKSTFKDHRRTMGTKFVPGKELDLEAAKAEREMELAFENFEEEPPVTTNRAVKTPDAKKSSLTDHRRTMGTKFVPEKEFDIKAAKVEREMELAFENFKEEPAVTTNRAVKTPDAKKSTLKDHRRTMGTKFVPEKELDLEAAKAEREMELAFKNFEEEPAVSIIRAVKTPNPKKSSLKDHRRTMGTKFVPEMELDVEAAKAKREMELAFENFEEEPAVTTNRGVKTPDPKKSFLSDHRRTLGTKFVPERQLAARLEVKSKSESAQVSPCCTNNKDATESVDHREDDQITRTIISDKVNVDKADERYLRRRQDSIDDNNVIQHEKEKELTRSTTVKIADRTVQLVSSDSQKEPEVQHISSDSQKAQVGSQKRNQEIEYAVVESECTDDEKKHDKRTRKNYGAVESSQSYEVIYQNLEPVVEKVEIQKSSVEESHKEILKQEEHKKSSLNLQAEVGTNVLDSNKCTRSVALSVVLLESSSSRNENAKKTIGSQKDVCEGDIQSLPIKIEFENDDDEFTNKTTSRANREKKEDTDEVISSTPATKTNQRRRPQRKPDSVDISGLGLRRTRRGSVQQDVEVKIEPVDADELSYSTPVHSVVHSNTEAISLKANQSTPARRRGRKPAGVVNLEEAIPSTPLVPKTRARRVAQKFGVTSHSKNEDIKITGGIDTEKTVNLAAASDHKSQTEEGDETVPSTPFQQVRRGRKVKKATPVGTTEKMIVRVENDAHDTEKEKDENLTWVRNASRRRGVKEVATNDGKAPSTEIEKLDGDKVVTDEATTIEESDGSKISEKGNLIEKHTNLLSPTEKTPSLRKSVRKSELSDSHITAKEEEEEEGKGTVGRTEIVVEIEGDKRKREAPTSTTTKPRTRRGGIKDEQQKATLESSISETEDKLKLSARVRSRNALLKTDQKDAEILTPIRKSARRRANDATAVSTQIEPANHHSSENKSDDDDLLKDSVNTSTPGRKRGRKVVLEKDVPVLKKAPTSKLDNKSKRRRLEGQDPETQTEEEDVEKSIPTRKRGRIADIKSEPKESQVNISTNVEVSENDSKDNSVAEVPKESNTNKKRGRVENVKSDLSESKTETPLRKKGRRQAIVNNSTKTEVARDESQNELEASEKDTKAETVQPTAEKEDNVGIVTEKLVRDRKPPSVKVSNTIVSDSEEVKVESDEHIEKRPTRARRAVVKENMSTEVSSSHTVEELGNKHASEAVTDVEALNTIFEDTSEKKPTRSRRAPAKLTAGISKSHAEEELGHKLPSVAEAVNTESEENAEKKSTRTRRAPAKKDVTVEVSSFHTEVEPKVVNATSMEFEENSVKKSTRVRRVPAKYNTSTEVSSSHTDDEHQKFKPASRSVHARKATSKSVLEDVAVKTSQDSTSEQAPVTEDEHQESKAVPKTVRGRRAAKVQDTKAEEKHTPTVRGRKPHAKTDTVPSEDDTVEKQVQKPIRSKRAAPTKPETPAANSSKVIAEESPTSLPKKTTRRRNAAVVDEPSESDEEDDQKDSTKKSSRSRKNTEPAVEVDESKLPRRGNRRVQEVGPNDDSSSTPKRPRRKARA